MKNLSLSIVIISVLIILLVSIPFAWSDDWEQNRFVQDKHLLSVGVSSGESPLYNAECGDCHMVYPAGLLPARSWTKIMNNLSDHFGENAEVSKDSGQNISEFLIKHSADNSAFRRSKAIMRKLLPSDTPIRITNMRYFKHEHHDIGNKLVRDNPDVGSFSNCNACHQRAESGSFSEREIRIPGHGRWDD